MNLLTANSNSKVKVIDPDVIIYRLDLEIEKITDVALQVKSMRNLITLLEKENADLRRQLEEC